MPLTAFTSQLLAFSGMDRSPSEHDLYPAFSHLLEEKFPISHRYLQKSQPRLLSTLPEKSRQIASAANASTEANTSSGGDTSSESADSNLSLNSLGVAVNYKSKDLLIPDFTMARADGSGEAKSDLTFLAVEIKLSSSKTFERTKEQLCSYIQALESYEQKVPLFGLMVYDDFLYFYRHNPKSFLKPLVLRSSFNYSNSENHDAICEALSNIRQKIEAVQETRYEPPALTYEDNGQLPMIVPGWVQARASNLYKFPPHFEASWGSIVRPILHAYFPPTSNYILKPEMLIRDAFVQGPPNPALWTDHYGVDVPRHLPYQNHLVDFGICRPLPGVDNGMRRQQIILLVELKSKQQYHAFPQIKRYMEAACRKIPAGERDTRRIFGLTICGGLATAYELPAASGPNVPRILLAGNTFGQQANFGSVEFFTLLESIRRIFA
ncbi:hypothetical protein DFP72DRAFT_839773 [Ephemerocybe angulata]|uniref:Uncharacterized protein n=1 Tax=Ephemerocybe angulata TaxID=980116 RepID=A0A8H6IJ06_9AGAR|nr:hypothetical protein DFP72DRAFT_839773 [Tulosesus angulatus]